MIIWCLERAKDFILTFSISGKFLSEKEFLNFYTIDTFFFSFRWMHLSKLLPHSFYYGVFISQKC